jgi:hypothetical protein
MLKYFLGTATTVRGRQAAYLYKLRQGLPPPQTTEELARTAGTHPTINPTLTERTEGRNLFCFRAKTPSNSAALSFSSESNGVVLRRARSGAVVRRGRRRRGDVPAGEGRGRWGEAVDAGAGDGEPGARAVDGPVGRGARGGGGGARGGAARAPHPEGGAPPPGRRRLPQAPHRLHVRLRGSTPVLPSLPHAVTWPPTTAR